MNSGRKEGWIVFRFLEHELAGGASLNRMLNRIKEIILKSGRHLAEGGEKMAIKSFDSSRQKSS
jgi:hypothetical protein